jgi:DNA-binding SARP family transcriptional activator
MDSSLDSRKPWERAFYHCLRARDALIQKDPQKAAYHAELYFMLESKIEHAVSMALGHFLKAYVMLELGEYQHAAEHIEDAFNIGSQIKSDPFKSLALFLKAQSSFHQGDESAGMESLRKALAYGKKCGHIQLISYIPNKMTELYAKALEAGIEVDLVQDIIRKRNMVPDDPPLHLENWPWTIQIFTLGRFRVVIDRKPFNSSKKTQKKPLEMLKVLISFGEGQEISKAKLSDILWPESDGDKAEKAFYITLHRLRQLLGHDKAIGLREGKLTLDLRYCWVDSMAFERILKRTEDYAEKRERNCIIQSLERAVALYRGPFLSEGADEPWAISYSERLRTKFLRAIEKLGSYLVEEGELDRAVECFHRAIEMDDIIEIFYQRLMICLKKLGRRAEALSVYQRCKKTLSANLGLEPSPETRAIKESLFE